MRDEAVPGTAGGTVGLASQPDPVSASSSAPTTRSRARLALMRNALPVGFVVLIAVFIALGAPNFFTVGNFSQMLRLSAPVMVVAIPMAFLLIMGYVDLSVGSMVALTAVVLGLAITELGLPAPLAVLVALLVGGAVGLINGLLVVRVGLAPVIVTLGSFAAVRGLAMWLAPSPVFGFGEDFSSIGYTGFLGVPWLVIVSAIVVLIGGYVLAISPIGRHVLAIGVNAEATFLSGVNVPATILGGYVATGLAAGLAGIMWAMLLNSAPSGTLGVGFELDVLTAVMLGGVAFNGGRGTIRGVVLGVLFLAILQNGLTLLNVQAAVAAFIKGIALVVAATLDRATLKAMFAVKGR
jgi:ribose/xylose/arabinose/galactoside ABC-type transport system permease subunit